jgi:ABC-type phosphate/phosphonate transport system substrate-binding protein
MLKRHPKVTESIVKGVIDGGATWDANLKASIQKYDDVFRVIAETKPIPLDNIAVGPHVSYQDSEAIKKAFLKLDADSPVIKKMQSQGYPFCGVTVRNDAFYNVVREIGERIYSGDEVSIVTD